MDRIWPTPDSPLENDFSPSPRKALTNLEEVTNNVEGMVKGRFHLLDSTWSKLPGTRRFWIKSFILASQQKLYERSTNEYLPERDTDNEKHYYMETFSFGELDSIIPPVILSELSLSTIDNTTDSQHKLD
ncbi:hypothetical protein HUJ04_001798 [Dendroctonus ponderosae]|nr:hypothetical protein HUJ04_001798 [Dendroctonus ponderosae]KAH1017449.1 hypothetical protein HUJ05_008090 [Dendroctonus ponderosae]